MCVLSIYKCHELEVAITDKKYDSIQWMRFKKFNSSTILSLAAELKQRTNSCNENMLCFHPFAMYLLGLEDDMLLLKKLFNPKWCENPRSLPSRGGTSVDSPR